MGNRHQPTRRLPVARRWSGLTSKVEFPYLAKNYPKALVVIGPRVFRLRSAAPPRETCTLQSDSGRGFEVAHRIGRAQSEEGSDATSGRRFGMDEVKGSRKDPHLVPVLE